MASQIVPPNFNIGDQVSVNLELDVFQALQGGHSRWKPEMAKCMGRVGNVLGIGPGYVEVSVCMVLFVAQGMTWASPHSNSYNPDNVTHNGTCMVLL